MMIKKITNWVFGSFFRTMGRFFFFLFFGFLLATILSRSNIQWTDLLGIEMVNAAELVVPVSGGERVWWKPESDSGNWTSYFYDTQYTKNIRSVSSFEPIYDYITFTNETDNPEWDTSKYQYVEFSFKITTPSSNYYLFDDDNYCSQWMCYETGQTADGNYICRRWICWDDENNTVLNVDPPQELSSLNFHFTAKASDNVTRNCTINQNSDILCPTNGYDITRLNIFTYYRNNSLNGVYPSIQFYINRFALGYKGNQTVEAIENATQQQIESQQVCQTINNSNIIENDKYLSQDGNVTVSQSGSNGVTDYIKINSNDILKILVKNTSGVRRLCYYNANKININCISTQNLEVGTKLTIPNNAEYFRATISGDQNIPQLQLCQNGNQAINNFINDDSTIEANTTASNFFSNFTTQDNGGISSIITAPLNAISGLVSSSCQQIVLPIPYLDNSNIVLPCMSAIYTEHFGQFFTIYQTIIFGAIAYRMLVSIFMMIQGFKNPDDDKIEVVDL